MSISKSNPAALAGATGSNFDSLSNKREPRFVEQVKFSPHALVPDREALAAFIDAVFKHADPHGFVSVRAHTDAGSERNALFSEPITIGHPKFLDVVYERALQAAVHSKPAVFCPPVVTFRSGAIGQDRRYPRRRCD
jgi:hypothetical protein